MVLGAQTYTVRAFTQSSADLRESLRRIARMGYTTVQLSAVGNMDARTLRDAADEAALKIVLTHIAEGRILQDTAAVIAEHEILGCDYIGLGAMSERYRRAEWIDRFWLDFERPAKMMRDAGKLFMYHNHNFEFGPLADGSRIIDRLMVRSEMEKLPENERMVLYLRYFKGMTQDRSAKVLQISQVQVSRLERRALSKLRQKIS